MHKIIAFFSIITVFLSGCGVINGVVNTLDASIADEQRVYSKPTPLPPLEIPANLATAENTQNDYHTDER